ncbi:uncharacterized protein METZ01_LOCUS264921, partial [marine metagenome]
RADRGFRCPQGASRLHRPSHLQSESVPADDRTRSSWPHERRRRGMPDHRRRRQHRHVRRETGVHRVRRALVKPV